MTERAAVSTEQPATTDHPDKESRLDQDDMVEIRFWLRLLTCSTLIEREVRARLQREFDITLSRFDVLAQLERTEHGLTMGELSRRMMVTHGNATGLVERLVADGMVARHSVDGDRRAHRVALTKTGRADFRRMAKIHHGWICELLQSIDAADLEDSYKQLGQLKRSILAADLITAVSSRAA